MGTHTQVSPGERPCPPKNRFGLFRSCHRGLYAHVQDVLGPARRLEATKEMFLCTECFRAHYGKASEHRFDYWGKQLSDEPENRSKSIANLWDILLIVRIGKGDHLAFEWFLVKYQKIIYRYVQRFLGDATLAEDVTQEWALDIFRKTARTFSGQSEISTWNFGIARNKAIDAIRKRGRWKNVFESIDHDSDEDGSSRLNSVPDPNPDFETITIAIENIQRLNQAIDSLPPNYREVIHLHYYEELSYEEIAKIIQKPETTVKARLYTARCMLKEILTKKAEGENE